MVKTKWENDNNSVEEIDADIIPDEPTSEIEDNVDTIVNSSTDDEEHSNIKSQAVREYWSFAFTTHIR